MKYDEISSEILRTVKGLEFPDDYEHYDLPYLVVEDYLLDHQVSGKASTEDINTGFVLMLRMAESDDEDARVLLDVRVIEWFEAWSKMGKRQQIARFLSQTPDALDAALHREFPQRWPQLRADLGLVASE